MRDVAEGILEQMEHAEVPLSEDGHLTDVGR